MDKIEKDFEFLKTDKGILAVLLFGSKAKNYSHEKSDYDICIVAPKKKPGKILMKIFRNLDVKGKNYDVHIFEELPLYLKMGVIKNHKIVFTKDKYGMYEYFYFYRKLWKDQAGRNEMTKKEILRSI